jgi:ubiquinone/menaquinone biosynthesis C-methylase UbiE
MIGLKMRTNATLVVGMDLSAYAARKAKSLTGNEIIVASAMQLPFRSGAFDLVTALELVEHLNDISAHLLETHRVLTSQGVYFASSPNRFGTSRLLEVLGLSQANPTHIKLYAVGELRKELRAAGFLWSYTRPVQMGVPLPHGMFVPLFFPLLVGSSIFACGQK